MRIAFLSPITLDELKPLLPGESLPQGLHSSLFIKLIYYYLEQGNEVVICTTDTNLYKHKCYKCGNINIFVAASIKIAKVRAATRFLFEIRQMQDYLKDNPCDIYHAHWSYEFALAALGVNPKRTLVTIHDWAPNIYELYNDFYRSQRYKMNNKVMKKGIYFSAVSAYIEDKFNSLYYGKNIRVIPNYLSKSNKSEEIDKKLNSVKPIIIAINNGFNKAKNTETTIKAFKIIRDEIPTATLIMFGTGFEIGGKASKWAQSKNLQSSIEFRGKVSHDTVLEELNRADLLIHTSLEESFGMVILEAMQRKVAVVGGKNSGAIPWLLNAGKCGALVDVEDENEVARASIEILKSLSVWSSYISYGSKRVNDFSLENVAGMYMEYYKYIINS